jgi:hypothetical protein
VVAQLRGIWWLSCLRRYWVQRSSCGFDPGFFHSLLRGGRNNDCVSKIKSQDVKRPFLSKKQFLKKIGFTHFDITIDMRTSFIKEKLIIFNLRK